MNKVLIIEDDLLVSNIYRNKLAVEGFEVETAPDGESGIELVQQFQPDALLLDLMLPKMSGLDVLRTIRGQPASKAMPVIVLSNTYLSSMLQDAWKAGATKCLSKASCPPPTVIEVIRSTLSASAASDAAGANSLEESETSAVPPARPPLAPVDEDTAARFRQDLPTLLTEARTLLQNAVRSPSSETCTLAMKDLQKRIHTIAGAAAMAGLSHVARMAEPFEALLQELLDKPVSINPSTLRTSAAAVDLLVRMTEVGADLGERDTEAPTALVVDDDAICLRAVRSAVEKAKIKPIASDNPAAAYDMLTQTTFDLVVLDVDMPGMNGFELCSRLRGLATNKDTPVVFVTGLTSFESRANSTMSGGNDFIGKPFLAIELAVKALTHIWRSRLSAANAAETVTTTAAAVA